MVPGRFWTTSTVGQAVAARFGRLETAISRTGGDLRDFGSIDMTGSHDEASTLQSAITQLASESVDLFIPRGKLAVGSTILLPEGGRISGAGAPGGAYHSTSTFIIQASSAPVFTNSDNTGSRALRNFGIYTPQAVPGVGWAPVDYDFAIKLAGAQDMVLEDINLFNASRGIKVLGNGAAPSGRLIFNRISGQPLICGMDLTHCEDVIRIPDLHFWPIWSGDPNVSLYTRANAYGIRMGRVDNPMLGRVFVYGCRHGVAVYQQAAVGALPAGTVGKLTCQSLHADDCTNGLIIESGANGATLAIDSFYAGSNPDAPSGTSNDDLVTIAASSCRVDLGSTSGQFTNKSFLNVTGTGNTIEMGTYYSSAIDRDNSGDPEFNMTSGNTLRHLALPFTVAPTVYSSAGDFDTPDVRQANVSVAAQAGLVTTASALVRYTRRGKVVHFKAEANVGDPGTASGDIRIGLPFQSNGNYGFGSGRSLLTGNVLAATIQPNVAYAIITNYDNTFPAPAACVLAVSGWYEIA